MDAAQASTGEKIVVGSAVVLFIALFLPWYGVKVEGAGVSVSLDETLTAWKAFSFVDILLFGAAATVIAVVVASVAGALPVLPVPPGLILLGAGGLALLLVLVRLLVAPEVAGFPEDFDVTRKFGIFIALLAAGGMAYGAVQASREV